MDPRTPGFNSVRIKSASSSTLIFSAAEEAGIPRISAISLTHRDPFCKSSRILILLSDDNAFPKAISSFSFSSFNNLLILFHPRCFRTSSMFILLLSPTLCQRQKGVPERDATLYKRLVNIQFLQNILQTSIIQKIHGLPCFFETVCPYQFHINII